jgi:hypothetical protein
MTRVAVATAHGHPPWRVRQSVDFYYPGSEVTNDEIIAFALPMN